VFRALGAELAITWRNEKARPRVEPLARELAASITTSLDVEQSDAIEKVFATIAQRWGRLDFVLHSLNYAPRAELQGRVTDSSREGFVRAMNVSCHSFIEMARLAEPLMDRGGSLVTMSYLGAQEVVPRYGVIGPVKAALEAAVRYLAAELGPRGIRVNAVSPGPVRTRAASAIPEFDQIMADARKSAPLRQPVAIEDIGTLCAFLVSDAARAITGDTHYVDGGFHILA
jgi:enoyl-[acyl-carrier protein] reductase I